MTSPPRGCQWPVRRGAEWGLLPFPPYEEASAAAGGGLTAGPVGGGGLAPGALTAKGSALLARARSRAVAGTPQAWGTLWLVRILNGFTRTSRTPTGERRSCVSGPARPLPFASSRPVAILSQLPARPPPLLFLPLPHSAVAEGGEAKKDAPLSWAWVAGREGAPKTSALFNSWPCTAAAD